MIFTERNASLARMHKCVNLCILNNPAFPELILKFLLFSVPEVYTHLNKCIKIFKIKWVSKAVISAFLKCYLTSFIYSAILQLVVNIKIFFIHLFLLTINFHGENSMHTKFDNIYLNRENNQTPNIYGLIVTTHIIICGQEFFNAQFYHV